MIVTKHMFRIILISIIPGTGRVVKRIVFVPLGISAGGSGKGLCTLCTPYSFSVVLHILEIRICAKIVSLQCKTDMRQICGTGTACLVKSIFQLLDSAGY